MLEELLHQLGLGDKEIVVYLAILQRGKLAVPDIAKATKINRTTIYNTTKQLLEKGLITEDMATTPNVFIALPPQELTAIIAKEEKQIVARKNIVERLIPELNAYAKETVYSIPRIKFIPQVDLETYLYNQTPEWDNSLAQTDYTWWGFQDPHFAPTYEKWVEWYWQRPGSDKFTVKIITTEKEQELIKNEYRLREVMAWGTDVSFSAAIWVVGNYVVMIRSSEQPHYLIEINDAVLSHNLRELFRGIWSKFGK